MNKIPFLILVFILIIAVIFGGIFLKKNNASLNISPTTLPVTPTLTPSVGLANPASQNCFNVGGKLTIQTAEDGSQSGVCTLPSGNQCDEWALYRGECQ